MKTRHAAILLAGASALVLAGAANAQTAAPAAAGSASGEIVVTGSRVIQNGNNMPTPVTVLPVEQLQQLAPGPIAQALEELPELAGSRMNTANPGSGTTNAQALTFNLRNLSYIRTLTLFDGNRVPATSYDQLVDAANIPQMLLQRVDIVTGGVSAVYGSDSIAGVVNFVTDSKFNGFKLEASTGISNWGDARRTNIDAAAGMKLFDGRGHIEVGFQYIDDPGIGYRTDRPWGQKYWCVAGLGTAAVPFALHQDCRFSDRAFGGLISGAPTAAASLNGKFFATNGVLSTFNIGTPTGQSGYSVGGDGAYHDGSLATAVNSQQLFSRLDFDVTDQVHFYVQGGGTLNHIQSYAQWNTVTNLVISGQNAFLPAANQFSGTFKLSEVMSDMPRIDTNSHQNNWFVVGGFSGSLNFGGKSYDWKVNGQDAVAQSTTRNDHNINLQNFYAATDAAVNSAGQVVCRASLTNSAYSNCVPLNLFGPTAASAAAIAYVNQATEFTVRNGLLDFNATLSGSPFSDWAGPVSVALSGEWRRNSFSVFSTAQPTPFAFANCTGIQFNCTATTGLFLDSTIANRSPVHVDVGEIAFETEIPLLRGMPFAQDVSLNGAFRYTDYSTSGGVNSYKVGVTWQVDDEWKLRAVRSQDIRAPNLYELFQPRTVSNSATVTDSLTGVTSQPTIISGGNPNLVPEIAQTTTAGFVYTPKWMPGRFSFSADAYYIAISQAIISQNPTANSAAAGATCTTYPSSTLCSLEVRPLGNYTNTSAANTVTTWYNSAVNVSDFKIYGVDFEANESIRLWDNPFTARALVTFQPHVVTCTIGAPCTDSGGGAQVSLGGGPAWAQPRLRASLILHYTVNKFDIGLQERWRSQIKLYTAITTPPTALAGAYWLGTQAYTDLNLGYTIKNSSIGTTQAYLTIKNLFNTYPQPYAGNGQIGALGVFGGFPLGDDGIGRYFTVGIRFRH
jgi:outer membrane receptor protein involved in Fe transport